MIPVRRLAFIAVLMLLLSGCRQSSNTPGHQFTVDSIKGDTLGMQLAAYEKAHRDLCWQSDSEYTCSSDDTYAGLSAKKMARFLDGRLFEVVYIVDGLSRPDLLRALTEKYGEPGRSSGNESTWGNGTATMLYRDFQSGASVSFSLDALVTESVRRESAKRAADSKNDQ